MKFCNTLIIVFLIVEPFGISAELRLQPPWVQVIQHVNENYNVKCEGEGEKVWINPSGHELNPGTNPSVTVVKKLQENVVHLKFNKIRKEHKGFYNCTTIIRGKRVSKGFELIVIKPATFANISTDVVVSEGNAIVLDCIPDGEPTPEISWYFQDRLITDWSPSTNYRMQGVSLKIDNASRKESGTYTCRAFQKILQTRDAELLYRLRVRHKPFAEEENITVFGFHNEYRNLTCEVMAYPTAYFIWYRDNIPIDPKINNLKIYNDENVSKMEVSLSDRGALGKYVCEATNSLGTQIINLELRQTERPEMPKLLIHELFHTWANISVQVQLNPTYEFHCILSYTEYTYCSYEEKWKKAKVQICRNKRITNTNKTYCVIDNLKPLTKYAVKAEILNKGGSSNPSEELLFKTKKEAPLLNRATNMIKSYFLYFTFSFVLLF